LKDLIQVGIFQGFFVIAAIFIYKVQEINKLRDRPTKFSDYGKEIER